MLHKANLKAVRRVLKPKMTADHRQRRRSWTFKHCGMGVPDWAKVVFSGETKIARVGHAGLSFEWIDKGKTALEAGAISETMAFGASGIMIWGCITWNCPGRIARCNGIIKAHY